MLILRMLCVPESNTMSHAPSVETTAPYGDVYDAASRSPVRLPMTPPVPLYVVTAHDGIAPANEKYHVILPFALASAYESGNATRQQENLDAQN